MGIQNFYFCSPERPYISTNCLLRPLIVEMDLNEFKELSLKTGTCSEPTGLNKFMHCWVD